MANRRMARISLGLALALASCLRSSVPEFPSRLSATLQLSERPSGPHGPAPFEVVAAGPRGEVDTVQDPGVTLVFNRPMRALGVEGERQPLPDIRFETEQGQAVPGSFRWVGKHGVLFEPNAKLPGATRFRVLVPAGTTALDGSRLKSDYELAFATVRPKLTDYRLVDPARPSIADAFTHARPDSALYFQFSQKVRPEALATGLKLSRRVAETASAERVEFNITVEAPPFVKSDTSRWLKVTPKQRWPSASSFDVEIAAGLVGNEGPLPTDAPIRLQFQTFGPLRIDNVKCARQSLGRCQAHRDFTLVTSTPVSRAELRRRVKVLGPKRPARPAKKDPSAPGPAALLGTAHPLDLDPDFGDAFEIVISPELTDQFGQHLGKEVRVKLAIEAPYVLPKGASTPRSDASRRSEVESGDGSAPPPDVPRRPLLFQDLELGVRGDILEALDGVGGKDGPARHRIPVGSVNVPSYGLRSWPSTEPATLAWLGNSSRFWVEPPAWTWVAPGGAANERAVRFVDLDATLGKAGRGAAFVQAMALADSNLTSRLLQVTDLGISARVSRFGSTVWVTHLSNGTPAKGATVSVYDREGQTLAVRTSDEFGLVDFSSEELAPLDKRDQRVNDLVLVARAGEDWTFERVQQTQAIRTQAWVDSAQKGQWNGLVFTDRGVYRPGESVLASGYFRRTKDKGFMLPKNQEVDYVLRDVNWEVLAQGRGKLDRFGALSLKLEIGKGAPLGSAQLEVRLALHSDEKFSTSFEILEFKPAEFKVAVDAVKAEAVHGATAQFSVHSEYLFGAPVAGGRVDARISRMPFVYTPPHTEEFVTNDDAYIRDLRHMYQDRGYASETWELDENGKAQRQVELNIGQPRSAEYLMLEAEVQDLTRQIQAGRGRVLVHPAEFYLGLQRPRDRFLAIGAALTPNVAAFSPDGKPVAGLPVRVELFRRNWTHAVEDRAADSLYYQTNVHDVPAGDCTLTTQAKPVGCALRLSEPGYYVARVSSQDRLKNPVFASTSLYVVDDRADSVPSVGWREPDHRELSLEFDRESYKTGEVAKLLVKNPFSAGSALVTVERGSILERRVVELKGPMPVVELLIKDDFFPNAFVSVHLLRGRTARRVEVANAEQADVGAPQFRVGYAKLVIDPNSRKLDVKVSTLNESYGPGDEVQATVQLKDTAGKPSAGSVTFYVVDEGVLMLTGYKTPEPLPAFSVERTLGAFPVESRDGLARIIALRAGERFEPRGWETERQPDYDSDKGYEGGDGGGLRANFRTTVFFEAGHPVGADGLAQFRFELPDNLTSFRLMAVAAGAGDRFGSADHTIKSSRPLMARPLLPRTLRVGDRFHAGVAVTSLGLPAGQAVVSFKPTGVKLQGAKESRLKLAASGQSEARFEVSVTKPGEVAFEFAAALGQSKDRVRVTREVTEPVHWLSAASYGATKDSVAIGLGELRGLRRDLGELDVTLSSSALVGLDRVFQDLIDYPYGCTEQLASRVLPVLSAQDLAAQQNVRLPKGRIEWVDEAIGQIASRQRYDGSFGYWENDDSDVPWLDAYALFALERASQEGYFVPRAIRDQSISGLTRKLAELVETSNRFRTDEGTGGEEAEELHAEVPDQHLGQRARSPKDQQQLRLAQAVFITDVLGSVGQTQKSELFALASFFGEMSVSTRAQLVHAMALARLPRQETQPLLEEVLSQTTIGPYEARVESRNEVLSEIFESPARTTAWVLRAVLAVDPAHPVASKLARGLVSFRQHASYRNTQENAWALLALEEYRKSQETEAPNFSAKVALGDELRGEFSFRGLPVHAESTKIPMAALLTAERPVLGLFAEGGGPMYYAVTLKAAKDGVSKVVLDEGLSIEKRMRSLEPAELEAAVAVIPRDTELLAGLGQLVVVDLLLESAEPRDQLVIDDPLPAGLEPIEFGFDTTARALATMNDRRGEVEDKPVPKTARWGQVGLLDGTRREMRDDRVVLFLSAIDAGIYHLRYLARATTPGRFVMPPTRVSCMYDPEIYGQTAGTLFEVSSQREPGASPAVANLGSQ
jgi:uncharacterized protein YfaS (alpha-2-macroglobulin family)